MQRQITEHFDVECDDRGKPYGYRWKVKAKGLSLPGMSQQESLLLGVGVVGRQRLRRYLLDSEKPLQSLQEF